jgi:hypothetical protein
VFLVTLRLTSRIIHFHPQLVVCKQVAGSLILSCGHKNGQVRAKMAGHLDSLLQQPWAHQMADNRGLLKQIVHKAAGLLNEGSPIARTFGKRILWQCNHLAPLEFQACRDSLQGETRSLSILSFQFREGPPAIAKGGNRINKNELILTLGSSVQMLQIRSGCKKRYRVAYLRHPPRSLSLVGESLAHQHPQPPPGPHQQVQPSTAPARTPNHSERETSEDCNFKKGANVVADRRSCSARRWLELQIP